MRLRNVSETSPKNRRRKRSDDGKLEQTKSSLRRFRRRPATIKRSPDSNESLALLPPDGPSGADAGALYVSDLTAWNHVRTAASLAAAASLGLAIDA